MRVSLDWLSDYVELPASPEELAQRLSLAGLEVETIERQGAGFSGVVVAEVVSKEPHPKADKLTVVQVRDDLGTHQVVCGASNVPAPGGRVLWARPGAKLPGMDIGSRDLRGVKSAGMLCSAAEIGAPEDGDGIVVLSADAKSLALGTTTAQQALGLDDTIFELGLTPNRGDCLSHLGMAREIAALFEVRLRETPRGPAWGKGQGDAESKCAASVAVDIADPASCSRYTARLIEGVKVGPAPAWMQQRLRAVGVRPLSNLVDATNYILFDRGQPLHAFDMDTLKGDTILVRRAKAGELFVTLDEVERKLTVDDLVIADAKGPVALAGVMGGLASSVTDKTTRILLESACFAPARVRGTAKRLALHSDSSHRFERGVDTAIAESASRKAAHLIVAIAGGRVLSGVTDVKGTVAERKSIVLREARVKSVLGVALPVEPLVRLGVTLIPNEAPASSGLAGAAAGRPASSSNSSALGGSALSSTSTGAPAQGRVWNATAPSHRADLTLEIDLIEEIARLAGYDKIPATLPRLAAQSGASAASTVTATPQKLAERVRSALMGAGSSESISYGFTSRKRIAALRLPPVHAASNPLSVINPLSEDAAVLRTSLLPGLLGSLALNVAHGQGDVALFEVGHVFIPKAERTAPPDEPLFVAGVLAGKRAGWLNAAAPVDFFDMRGTVETLCSALGLTIDFVPARHEDGFLHPGIAAVVRAGEQSLGVVGALHPETRDALGLHVPVFAFELNLSLVPAHAARQLAKISRHPGIVRDVSLLVDASTPVATVRRAIWEKRPELLENTELLEVYTDAEKLPPGKKSLLWSMTYRAADRTLTDKDVDSAHESLVGHVLTQLGAQRR